jgi:TonB-linked SusC/RagA family outer membrane protein
MQKRRFLLALLLCMLWLTGFAQKSVSGTVKDKTGEPLIGVSVTYGSGQGTVTDIDGKFQVNVPAGTTLKLSYVGYKPQSVKAGSNLNITLEEDNTTLEDVVVVGYGTMKRKDLTGAVASVSGEKLAANPVANVAQALQGQLPGVSVISQDGRPGATMSIRVRGGGSITQSNDPLYIVDGVTVSDISDIPADNIESIDVLKDAASTAIYGARGANGVILITTKGSKGEGKAKVKYNVYYQIKTNPKKLDVMNAYDYVRHTWSYAQAYGDSYGNNVAKYFGLGSANGNHLDEYKGVGVHDYVDEMMRTAKSWNHDLSLTGGNDKTKYYAALNYLSDDGILVNTGFKRWNANFKVSQKITKNLLFDVDLRYSEMKFEGVRQLFELATSSYRYRPIDKPFGDDSPNLMGQGDSFMELSKSPMANANNYQNRNARQRIRATGGLTWTPLKGLTAKSELSLGRYWNETNYWDGGLNDGYTTARLTQGKGYNVRWSTTLNYVVQGLGEAHNLSFLAGNEVLASNSSTSHIYGSGYSKLYDLDTVMARLSLSDSKLGKDEFGNVIGVPSHTVSWFGRVNYDFLGRYLFTATFRADGSSKFAPNHHWGYFPAAAAAWRISDEPFMANTKDWLDNLKLRLSIGTSGSDNIDASLWQNDMWTTDVITVDGVATNIYKPADLMGNEDLKWEKTISRNLGLDFGFWNGKLRGSIEAYWNTTKDILMRVPVDATTGYSYQYQNVGKTSNKGIELSLFYEIIRSKDFNLSVNATYNYNKNNIDELADNVIADTHTGWGSSMLKPYYDYIIREGQPVGTIQGYKSAGFYTVDDFDYDATSGIWTLKTGIPDISDIINYASGNVFKGKLGQRKDKDGNPVVDSKNKAVTQNAFPGMAKFEDVNGDGIVNTDDMTDIGHAMPKHTGGFNINANYKGFDFAAGFTYQIGGDVYNANAMHSMMGNKDNSLGANRLAFVSDCWKMYDIDANGDLVAATTPDALRSLNANAKYALPYSEYGIVSSEFIEDASYLRLNTLTIGYTFPKAWTKKVGISNLRAYITGGNLFCITGYNGLDPDVNTAPTTGGFPTPGYDYLAYPKARTFTFGLNVAF